MVDDLHRRGPAVAHHQRPGPGDAVDRRPDALVPAGAVDLRLRVRSQAHPEIWVSEPLELTVPAIEAPIGLRLEPSMVRAKDSEPGRLQATVDNKGSNQQRRVTPVRARPRRRGSVHLLAIGARPRAGSVRDRATAGAGTETRSGAAGHPAAHHRRLGRQFRGRGHRDLRPGGRGGHPIGAAAGTHPAAGARQSTAEPWKRCWTTDAEPAPGGCSCPAAIPRVW